MTVYTQWTLFLPAEKWLTFLQAVRAALKLRLTYQHDLVSYCQIVVTF